MKKSNLEVIFSKTHASNGEYERGFKRVSQCILLPSQFSLTLLSDWENAHCTNLPMDQVLHAQISTANC